MTLLENKYARIYLILCERARNRVLSGYSEKHHVVPRSLGGTLAKSNLVRLTPREHYIAHMCLVRCTEGEVRKKMVYAVHMLRFLLGKTGIKFSSRLFEINRQQMAAQVSQQRKGKRHTPEARQMMSEKMKGHRRNVGFRHSDATKHLMSTQRKGKCPHPNSIKALAVVASQPKTEEWKAHMRQTMTGNKNALGCKRSEAHKQAIAAANRRRAKEHNVN